MTSSLKTSFLSEIASGEPIPHSKLAYLQERQRNRIYHFILTKFLELERAGKLTKAELARRIQRRPEQITRLLGAPGNWTLDTLSDLLVGIAAEELEPASTSLLNRTPRNYAYPDWVRHGDERRERTGAESSVPLRVIEWGSKSNTATTATPRSGVTITFTG